MSHATSGRPPLPTGFFSDSDDVDCAYLWEYLDINENREEALPAPQANPDISEIGVSGIFLTQCCTGHSQLHYHRLDSTGLLTISLYCSSTQQVGVQDLLDSALHNGICRALEWTPSPRWNTHLNTVSAQLKRLIRINTDPDRLYWL